MAAAGLSLLVMLMPCMADEPSRPVCEEITSCQECFRSGCFGWQLGRESGFFLLMFLLFGTLVEVLGGRCEK